MSVGVPSHALFVAFYLAFYCGFVCGIALRAFNHIVLQGNIWDQYMGLIYGTTQDELSQGMVQIMDIVLSVPCKCFSGI